jgi:hypothetical protein
MHLSQLIGKSPPFFSGMKSEKQFSATEAALPQKA